MYSVAVCCINLCVKPFVAVCCTCDVYKPLCILLPCAVHVMFINLCVFVMLQCAVHVMFINLCFLLQCAIHVMFIY